MRIIANAWQRNRVANRMLADYDFSDAKLDDGYPWNGVAFSLVDEWAKMTLQSGPPVVVRYGFKAEIHRTMGGIYAIDVYLTENDVLHSFRTIFEKRSVSDLLTALNT